MDLSYDDKFLALITQDLEKIKNSYLKIIETSTLVPENNGNMLNVYCKI